MRLQRIRANRAVRRTMRLRAALSTQALRRPRLHRLVQPKMAHPQATPPVALTRPGTLWLPARRAAAEPSADRRITTARRAAEAPPTPLVLQPTITRHQVVHCRRAAPRMLRARTQPRAATRPV